MTKIWIPEKPRLTINWQRIRSKILHIVDDLTSPSNSTASTIQESILHSSCTRNRIRVVAGTLQLLFLLLLGGYQKQEGTDNNYLPINPAGRRVHNRGSQVVQEY
jgi:hypothetical protein